PARRTAARAALAIARDLGWQDSRRAFSHFAVGRLSQASELEAAVTNFAEAARIWRGLPGGAIHVAHVDMQMAAFALSSGQADRAQVLVDRALPVVAGAENAALLATLLMIRAEALALQGRAAEARAARLDSLGWARYGFGDEDEVRDRLGEIALLAPRRPGG
ncbi:MAG: ATP-dependent transcriptional regulator, partial [Rhodobacterales bacterium]|nr:ATP-dependent transcriptional regulator [Rhodobacterales bacterium]